jgi:glutamate synthase (ferredoxin)
MTGGVVLVLGATGRNFAAGMTGGLAYVFDEAGDFALRCNSELVTLDQLDAGDEANVRALLAQHHRLTRSQRAADLLEGWSTVRGQFCRVAPKGLESIQLPQVLLDVRERVSEARR